MKTRDEIIELAHNKTCEDIVEMNLILSESIRQFLSRFLMDTSEENPKKGSWVIETDEDCGISDAQKITINSMYQHPTEGLIYIRFDGDDYYYNIDELSTELLVFIVQALS